MHGPAGELVRPELGAGEDSDEPAFAVGPGLGGDVANRVEASMEMQQDKQADQQEQTDVQTQQVGGWISGVGLRSCG